MKRLTLLSKIKKDKIDSRKNRKPAGKMGHRERNQVPVPSAPSSAGFLPGAQRLQGPFLILPPPRDRKDNTLTTSLHQKEKPDS